MKHIFTFFLIAAAAIVRADDFGRVRVYYNNFAEHLLNAFNPNMTYPDLPYRWSDEDWSRTVDMVADFGFTRVSFWLVPRLFAEGAAESEFGRDFRRQMSVVAAACHRRGLELEALCSLATTGDRWQTLCPNLAEDRAKIDALWTEWVNAMPYVDVWHIFPGDPGACSLRGCTAETYIDISCEVANLITGIRPKARIVLNTWGPPFFGWGNIRGPEGWNGEFVQSYQGTAWTFDAERCRRAMEHLIARLGDFPEGTAVAVNLGFDPDGRGEGETDARGWAKRIAATNPVQTWDFSLTEGEGSIVPHYRFERLFAQRRTERAVGAYSGGICYTMTPRLNPLSLYESAQSFINPDADGDEIAREFYTRVFGEGGAEIVEDLILFEIVPDWGNYVRIDIQRKDFNARMARLAERLKGLEGKRGTLAIWPSAENHRRELLFFAELFRDLSGESPDYEALAKRYWEHVFAIYDSLPEHVDPRPHGTTSKLIDFFRSFR